MTSIGHCLWIKFIAAPIIPSCRYWLLKIISLSFAVKSKFWIYLLLVCAISGGEIGISLRCFFNLNSFVLDEHFDNWLEKIVSFSVRIFNLYYYYYYYCYYYYYYYFYFTIKMKQGFLKSFHPLKIVLNEPFVPLCLQ